MRLPSLVAGCLWIGTTFVLLVPCPCVVTLAGEPAQSPRFVAVGYGLRRLTSTDGIHWQNDMEETDAARARDKDYLLRGVTFADGLIVAVGGSRTSRILVSADGRKWTEHSVQQNWLGDVAHGNGLFVAVGYQRALYSRNGKDWSRPVPVRQASWRRIAFGNGRFVAVGDVGSGDQTDGYYATTTDARQWTCTRAADTKRTHDIAFGKDRFVAVGSHGLRESSKDGVTWEHRTLGDRDEVLSTVIWTGTEFWAIGNRGAYTSADGLEWKKGPARMPSRICYGNNVFVGCSGGRFSYSADGQAWKPADAKGTLQITKIIFNNGS